MTDLSVTAASVASSGGGRTTTGIAGVAVTAGQVGYLDTATNTWKLADSNSATAAARSPQGIFLNSAGAGQPVKVHKSGPLTIGATLIPGTAYFASGTPGGLCAVADLTTGMYPTIVGIAKSTTILDVKFHESGVAL